MKSFLWTLGAIGFGIFISTFRIQGRTPLEQGGRFFQQTMKPAGAKMWIKAKDAVSNAQATQTPVEHHTDGDRARLENLLAKRGQSK